VTHPPDVIETRPPPVVDEDKLRQIYQRTDSAILGGKIVSVCCDIPYILESNAHPFYSFRGLKNQMRIRFACGLDSRS
jgi:hypothetical protein